MFKKKTQEERDASVWRAEFLALRTEAKMFKEMQMDKSGTIFDRTGAGGSMNGARASVLTEGEIRDRFTATRILAIGVFALAFKKKTSDKDVFVVIEHPEYTLSIHVPSKEEDRARKWARRFNVVAEGMGKGFTV